jgi:predicted ATP-grasp superfamily ATP-dependent carboligase
MSRCCRRSAAAREVAVRPTASNGGSAGVPTLDQVVASALRTFESLNISGLASVDFIRRPNGDFAFLEINPRPWGSIGAARDAGVDLFTPLADLLRGTRREPDLAYDVGVSSSVFPLYWRRSTNGPRQAAHLSRRFRPGSRAS